METTRVALILNSLLSEIELLQTINEDFGIPANSDSKRDLIRELNQFLIRENEAGHNVVLIIDEAQNLSVAVLEEIRMLSNLETETSKLIQIVLMGQPELQDILSMQELEQLNQRISVRYHISALDRQDVPYYIKHRLFVALRAAGVDHDPAPIERTLHDMFDPFRQGRDRHLFSFIDLLGSRLFKMGRGQLTLMIWAPNCAAI